MDAHSPCDPVASVSKDESFEKWLDTINSACGSFHADTRPGQFEGRVQPRESGGVRLSYLEAAHARLFRTAQDTNRSDDQKFFTVLQLGGRSDIVQGDRTISLETGDIVLIDAGQPVSIGFEGHARQISLILPRAIVERNLRSANLQLGNRIKASTPVAGLARGLVLEAYSQSEGAMSLREGEAILDALATLLRPAIDQGQDQEVDRSLRRALDYIDLHLQSDELTPEQIAASIGISVRSLYRAFARQGLIVAQYIRNRRLDRCAASLRTMRSGTKLAALCYDWGFPNPSHFSRAFKARFGISPGQYHQLHVKA
ncbi:transcriptional regulator FeaR (plasmid) [Massilia varians]